MLTMAVGTEERKALLAEAQRVAKELLPALKDKNGIGLTQLRMLVDACQGDVAVAEIRALIEYQCGKGVKERSRSGWALPLGKESAASLVLTAIELVLRPYAGKPEAEQRQVLGLFFGYLHRAAVALQPAKEGIPS